MRRRDDGFITIAVLLLALALFALAGLAVRSYYQLHEQNRRAELQLQLDLRQVADPSDVPE